MKCPFRTTTTVEKLLNKTVIAKDYAECLKSECPYFGKKERHYSDTVQRVRTYIAEKCRRADNA